MMHLTTTMRVTSDQKNIDADFCLLYSLTLLRLASSFRTSNIADSFGEFDAIVSLIFGRTRC